jgi:4-hydroxyacetophenone monooxygenase
MSAPGRSGCSSTCPYYDKWYRFFLFWLMTDGVYEMVKAEPGWNGPDTAVSAANLELRGMLIEALKPQVANRPELLDKIVPAYPFGGKRALRDNGVWVGALARDNVQLITDPITEINATGLKTADGTQHDVDVLIYGTGFSRQHLPQNLQTSMAAAASNCTTNGRAMRGPISA